MEKVGIKWQWGTFLSLHPGPFSNGHTIQSTASTLSVAAYNFTHILEYSDKSNVNKTYGVQIVSYAQIYKERPY